MGCRRRRVPAMVAGDIELISFLTIINIYIIKKIIIYIYIYIYIYMRSMEKSMKISLLSHFKRST